MSLLFFIRSQFWMQRYALFSFFCNFFHTFLCNFHKYLYFCTVPLPVVGNDNECLTHKTK